MDERYYLVKAQQAEALANASISELSRRIWENIARDYRKTAALIAQQRDAKISAPTPNNITRPPH